MNDKDKQELLSRQIAEEVGERVEKTLIKRYTLALAMILAVLGGMATIYHNFLVLKAESKAEQKAADIISGKEDTLNVLINETNRVVATLQSVSNYLKGEAEKKLKDLKKQTQDAKDQIDIFYSDINKIEKELLNLQDRQLKTHESIQASLGLIEKLKQNNLDQDEIEQTKEDVMRSIYTIFIQYDLTDKTQKHYIEELALRLEEEGFNVKPLDKEVHNRNDVMYFYQNPGKDGADKVKIIVDDFLKKNNLQISSRFKVRDGKKYASKVSDKARLELWIKI